MKGNSVEITDDISRKNKTHLCYATTWMIVIKYKVLSNSGYNGVIALYSVVEFEQTEIFCDTQFRNLQRC
jgi:hypothetical protein